TGLVDPNNRRLDRSNCNQDRRQIFSLTGVASTPKFSNATLNKVASGWRVSGIYGIRSGQFLSITTGTDVALTGISNQRANQILGDPFVDNVYTKTGSSGFLSYLNRAAFAAPTVGTLGNMGRNNVLGPVFWNFDMALSRTFQVREGQRLEVR